MQVVSYTDARNGLKRVLDDVVDNADFTVITRRDSENAVVMSQNYFNSLMETVHLLKSPANVVHLKQSIEQYRAGKTINAPDLANHRSCAPEKAKKHENIDQTKARIKNQQ